MARCSIATLLSLFLFCSAAAAQEAPATMLVRYSFDDALTDTGPDTFRVFENSRGSVHLTRAYRWSGESAVEIRDAAGDGDFPELQGSFPAVRTGTLYAHFAFLTTTPREEFNIALAGPEGFRLARNGIAFWLQGRESFLFHHSDSIPKRLFALEAFAWYFVDVVYRVEEGSYDLVIHREGDRQPRVALPHQPNAANQPGSIVDKFSFVGDVEDDVSRVVYYVDDVAIGTDQRISILPFRAPGRRRLFVERMTKEGSLLLGQPSCIPVSDPSDLGLEPSDRQDLKRAGVLDLFEALVWGQRILWRMRLDGLSGRNRELLEALGEWRDGCHALRMGEPTAALHHFEVAASKSAGRMYPLSSALALAALGRFADADELLAGSFPLWPNDPRYTLALAMAGGARGDLAKAEELLRPPAEGAFREEASPSPSPETDPNRIPGIASEKRCREMESWMISEQYFAVLLLNGFSDLAAQYADRMVDRLSGSGAAALPWLEKRGDAAFFAEDWETARRLYQQVGSQSPSALLKLADVYFRLGDLAMEKSLRERIYGSLHAP